MPLRIVKQRAVYAVVERPCLSNSVSDDGNHVERKACLRSDLIAVNTPTKAKREEEGTTVLTTSGAPLKSEP